MNDLQALLDQIDRLDQQATKGPWIDEDNALREILYHQRNELGGYAGSASLAEVLTNDADAEFIALARTALPQLAAAVKGVLDVLDTHPAPRKEADPTGYTTARLALLEQRIREAITDALKGDDDAS